MVEGIYRGRKKRGVWMVWRLNKHHRTEILVLLPSLALPGEGSALTSSVWCAPIPHYNRNKICTATFLATPDSVLQCLGIEN